jgi:uncharacterized membrane protein HdeD (DUF308 family)
MTDNMTAPVDVTRRLAILLALRGVLALLFGVLVLVWPRVTVLVLAVVFAIYAVVDGIGMVAGGLGRDGTRRWPYVLAGALQLAAAVRLRRERPGWWVLALSGVVSLIAGVIILARPDIGALALATVLGVYALLAGVALLWAAWQLRKARVVVPARG